MDAEREELDELEEHEDKGVDRGQRTEDRGQRTEDGGQAVTATRTDERKEDWRPGLSIVHLDASPTEAYSLVPSRARFS